MIERKENRRQVRTKAKIHFHAFAKNTFQEKLQEKTEDNESM